MREFLNLTKALSDESRVRILMLLREGELCVCQIIEMIGLAPSTVSKHMAGLVQAGLVDFRKEGKWRYYRLPGREGSRSVQRALKWLQSELGDCPVVCKDGKRLKTVMAKDVKSLCEHYK
jgi:ArsR family transcriptional regulator